MIMVVEVPLLIVVPAVIVFEAAMISVPIAGEKLPPVVVRRYPVCSHIRRASPVTLMPSVMSANRIPVAFYPYEIGTRSHWYDMNYTRGWRGPDSDSNGNLCLHSRSAIEKNRGNKRSSHKVSHHFSSPWMTHFRPAN
jgi:hypothetical protein